MEFFSESVKVPLSVYSKLPMKNITKGYQKYTNNEVFDSVTKKKNIGILTGKINGITVVDIDGYKGINRSLWEEQLQEHGIPETTHQLTRKKGDHYIFVYDPEIKQTQGLYNGLLDTRNDGGYFVCEPSIVKDKDTGEIGSYKFTNKIKPQPMPKWLKDFILSAPELKTMGQKKKTKTDALSENIQEHKEKNVKKIKEDVKHIQDTYSNEVKLYIQLLDIIDMKYIDHRLDAMKIVWACATVGEEMKEACKRIMKKSSKYEDAWYDRTWDESNGTMRIPTMLYYAKTSNPERFRAIYKQFFDSQKFDFYKFTEVTIATLFEVLYGDDFIVVSDILYHWNGVYWKRQHNDDQLKLKMSKELFAYLEFLLKKMFEKDLSYDGDSDRQKKFKELYSKLLCLHCAKFLDPTIKYLKMLLVNDVTLDEKWNLFVFEDAVYDLEQHTFIEPCKTDYMTMSCGKQYQKPLDEELKTVQTLVDKIFPNDDEKSIYLQILSSGLENRQVSKFVIANGSGGNGKSLLHEFYMYLLGNYSYVGDNETIQGKAKKAHEISLMHKKRFVLFSEPDANSALSESMVKQITGSETINARAIYSKDCETVLKNTVIMECNKNPKFQEANDALARRLIDFPFRSSFVEDISKHKDVPNIFEAEDIKHAQFYKKHMMALFHIITEAHKAYTANNYKFVLTTDLKERTVAYLSGCGDLNRYLSELLVKTHNKSDYVQLKDLYDMIKCSEFYNNMSKKDKRNLSYKVFCEEIENHFDFKNYHIKVKKIEGKCVKNFLQCYKIDRTAEEELNQGRFDFIDDDC